MKSIETRVSCVAIFLIFVIGLSAQPDPAIFTVDGEPVPVSEFTYIYEKTNPNTHDYSRTSIEESLDLYSKFKLKVAEAKSLGYDTLSSLNDELEGYRKQLSQDYLMDKEIVEHLAKEAYERQQYDVQLAQIFVKKNRMMDRTDEAKVIYDRLAAGEDFVALAKEYSEEDASRAEGGYMGWRTALFPSGFYDIETAAYTLDKGYYSEVLTSPVGYHIIKLLDKRPARGVITVQQILLANNTPGKSKFNKIKIDSIYSLLQGGANFDTLVAQYSEDPLFKVKNGVMFPFGIGTYTDDFEDEAFGLQKDGDYSRPFETSVGWHILRRVHLDKTDNYLERKKLLKAQIKTMDRSKNAAKEMIQTLKMDYNFKMGSVNYVTLLEDMGDKNVWIFQYEMPKNEEELKKKELFRFADQSYNEWDFAQYLQENVSVRAQRINNPDKVLMIKEIVEEFADEKIVDYEELRLEEKYPDFKSLMREYREGIMLFEIQKKEVWDKAVMDTVGLLNYFEDNKSKYQSPQVYMVDRIMINTDNKKTTKKILKSIQKKTLEETMNLYNKDLKAITSTRMEMSQKDLSTYGINPKLHALLPGETTDNGSMFYYVSEITPSRQLTFEEAKGAIILDYQNILEQNWLSELRKKHTLEINQDVVSKIIK